MQENAQVINIQEAQTEKNALVEYTSLEWEKRDLEEQLKSIQARQSQLEEHLLTQFEQDGIDHIRANGLTVYLNCRTFHQRPQGIEKEDLYVALGNAGYGDLVRPYAFPASLDGLVREFAKEHNGEIPEALQGFIEIGEKYSIKCRKA